MPVAVGDVLNLRGNEIIFLMAGFQITHYRYLLMAFDRTTVTEEDGSCIFLGVAPNSLMLESTL